ncbi:hypothetical protein Pst134EB_024798 [Puccinia striiformis f. sp. tritici]|nr:hypothetical protein Pst134EB_024798 [Puccinia striiformis f. sp. tritici]
MDSTNNQLNIPGSEPPGQSQPTNTRAMFTQENVEEILAAALARQAANDEHSFESDPCGKEDRASQQAQQTTWKSYEKFSTNHGEPGAIRASHGFINYTGQTYFVQEKAGLPSSPRKAASPGPKKAPHQMVTADFPPNFKDTKRCLFAHIRLLWGLVETRTVPPPANPEHIRSFCANFQTINEVQRYLEDSNSAALIANEDILTLKDARAGVTQVGKGFIHIDDGHISYIHAQLAKLGIRCWGPNLDEGPESLFNAACRIAALTIFQQIAVAGGYNFLNFNHNYKDDMLTFIRTYNHYVHHVPAKKYR